MRKILILLLALILSFGLLAGCGDGKQNDSVDGTASSASTSVLTESTAPKDTLSSAVSTSSKTDTSSQTSSVVPTLSGKEAYMEDLKKNSVFKQYDSSDWRSHAYDYKLIAFTFDDGPAFTDKGDNVTTRIIDLFENYEGAASFFFTGGALEARGTKIPEYALSKGHELANHSYHHTNLGNENDQTVSVNEVEFVNNYYLDNLNYTCKFFRGGGYSANSYAWNYLNTIGMPAIKCVKGFDDYSGGTATAESIISWFNGNTVTDGAIIGMHSTNTTNCTPDALEVVLPKLYNEGYRFCTLSELFTFRGVEYKSIPKMTYISKVEISESGRILYN